MPVISRPRITTANPRSNQLFAQTVPGAAVKRFTTKPQPDPAAKPKKGAAEGPKHSVGFSPGQDESRVVFDVYDYIGSRAAWRFSMVSISRPAKSSPASATR